jgi:hypothetical protein
LSGDVSPLSIFVPVLDDRSDDVADDLEGTLGDTKERLGLLAHGHELHLGLAALGDGDGLAALGTSP